MTAENVAVFLGAFFGSFTAAFFAARSAGKSSAVKAAERVAAIVVQGTASQTTVDEIRTKVEAVNVKTDTLVNQPGVVHPEVDHRSPKGSPDGKSV